VQQSLTLSVIVPVYNERVTVGRLLDKVRAVPLRKEIVVVDDGSSDGTRELLREIEAAWGDDPQNRLRIVFHDKNAGKGAAIRTGIQHVGGDITLIQDADLEYDPDEYPQLIAPIVAGQAEVVFGSRFLSGPHRVVFFWHAMGNRLLTLLSNLFTDLNLTDMETCYKVFRTDVLKRIRLVSDRFGIEPELTAKVARLGCRIYEVPISYHGREYWEGKKIGWKDGVVAVWTILRFGLFDDQVDASAAQTTLKRLHRARRYNEWVFGRLSRHLGDRVLEVGSGRGAFTRFLRNRDRVVATESDPDNLEFLRSGFERFDNIAIREVDWRDPNLGSLAGERFDTILGMQVLEHLEDDSRALAAFAELLPEGGRLILKVPAMKSLFGETDRKLGRVRRYDRGELEGKLAAAGFVVEEATYVNVLGVLGWWISSVLLKRPTVGALQPRLANWLSPLYTLEEKWRPRFGLSLLVAATKRPRSANTVPADGTAARIAGAAH
jgi:SAM-dependent methyltransferase